MTAIKPATSLPWESEYQPTGENRMAGAYVVAQTAAVAYMSPQGTRDAESNNAAYIVHACNAYPELVAALQRFVEIPLVGISGGAATNLAFTKIQARALLARLGEQS